MHGLESSSNRQQLTPSNRIRVRVTTLVILNRGVNRQMIRLLRKNRISLHIGRLHLPKRNTLRLQSRSLDLNRKSKRNQRTWESLRSIKHVHELTTTWKRTRISTVALQTSLIPIRAVLVGTLEDIQDSVNNLRNWESAELLRNTARLIELTWLQTYH